MRRRASLIQQRPTLNVPFLSERPTPFAHSGHRPYCAPNPPTPTRTHSRLIARRYLEDEALKEPVYTVVWAAQYMPPEVKEIHNVRDLLSMLECLQGGHGNPVRERLCWLNAGRGCLREEFHNVRSCRLDCTQRGFWLCARAAALMARREGLSVIACWEGVSVWDCRSRSPSGFPWRDKQRRAALFFRGHCYLCWPRVHMVYWLDPWPLARESVAELFDCTDCSFSRIALHTFRLS